jgi:hypothetical protein
VQETNWVVQTLEFGFREVLKIVGIVVWEQVLEGWHQLDDRNLGTLFFQDSNRRICKRLEVRCDYDVLASRLVDEVGNTRSRIPGRNCEGGTFCADNSKFGGGIRECVWTSRHGVSTW